MGRPDGGEERRYLCAQEGGLQFYLRSEGESSRLAAREGLYRDVLARAGDRLSALGECRRVDRSWAEAVIADGILA